MATVLGTSGAWKEILRCSQLNGLTISHPRDINRRLQEIRADHSKREVRFLLEVGEEAAELEAGILSAKHVFDQGIASKTEQTNKSLAALDAKIVNLRGKTGVFRRIFSRLKILEMEHRKRKLLTELEEHISRIRQTLAQQEKRLQYIKENKTKIVKERMERFDAVAAELEALLSSKELAGAQAEIEVIEQLTKLPNDYFVLNDVHLRAENFMRFKGVPLQSAQADHIVVGPSGVSIIEVKNWSREFMESREYFDPYDQIGRARFLCQCILRDHGYEVTVRDIIAYRGSKPDKPEGSYTKAVSVHLLVGYIMAKKDPVFDGHIVEGMKLCLEHYLNEL